MTILSVFGSSFDAACYNPLLLAVGGFSDHCFALFLSFSKDLTAEAIFFVMLMISIP